MFNRSKAWALALLAAAFVAGGAVGWGLDEWLDHGNRGRRRGTDAMVEYLDRQLGLRAAQRDSVRAVFLRYRTAMDSIWSEVHPRVDSLRNLMRAEVSAQLDSVQRERYARLIAERGHQHRKADSAKDTTGGRR
ncbi:MAG TPA: periplasmic heavy metal sensor [Gemmatimonadales bacterium]|nr:periplasmic heavy metal sensor [Gemmatimonadales bacterium]